MTKCAIEAGELQNLLYRKKVAKQDSSFLFNERFTLNSPFQYAYLKNCFYQTDPRLWPVRKHVCTSDTYSRHLDFTLYDAQNGNGQDTNCVVAAAASARPFSIQHNLPRIPMLWTKKGVGLFFQNLLFYTEA